MTYEALSISTFLSSGCVLVIGTDDVVCKALVDKILSCCDPWLVYVIVHDPDGMKKSSNGADKIIPKVVTYFGNLSLHDLGLNYDEMRIILQDVSVVYHIGVTDYKASLTSATETNLLGTLQVLHVCHEIKNLKALVHVSTVFLNNDERVLEEIFYQQPICPEVLIEYCKWMTNEQLTIVMKKFEVCRNNFALTKALSEELIAENGSGLPVAILRVSLVAELCSDVLDIQHGNILVSQDKTHSPSTILVADVVPVVGVVNMLLAVSWYLAVHCPKRTIIYHCAGARTPCVHYAKIQPSILTYEIQRYICKRRRPSSEQKIAESLLKSHFQFSMENVSELKALMSEEDKTRFNINLPELECKLTVKEIPNHKQSIIFNFERHFSHWKLLVFCFLWRRCMVRPTPLSQIIFVATCSIYLLVKKFPVLRGIPHKFSA